MPSIRFFGENNFVRKTEDDPTGISRYFRMGRFGYFDKPEGQGCAEKFFALNYQALWGTMPFITLYYLGFKKIRTPLGFFFNYGKAAWPFHAAASAFSIASCAACQYRGKDDWVNWAIAGGLTGAIPGIAARSHVLKVNAYGKGLWLYTVPLGAIFTGTLLGLIKANNPRQFTEIFELMDEKLQYNPEKHLYLHETHTMPGERWSLDPIYGGFGKDMPISWLGEKWEDRRRIIQRDYGYLEGELDQVPAIEKAIRERM